MQLISVAGRLVVSPACPGKGVEMKALTWCVARLNVKVGQDMETAREELNLVETGSPVGCENTPL